MDSVSLYTEQNTKRSLATIGRIVQGNSIVFARESLMKGAVIAWLEFQGLMVKREFVTPWGVCDLVGLAFNRDKVAHRLGLRQNKAVGSVLRAALLLQIPDVETGESVTLDFLAERMGAVISAEVLAEEMSRLIAGRFVIHDNTGGLQKVNGWTPLHERMVAVELKLLRVQDAMRQATNNLGFVDESYVGLPSNVADGVSSNPIRRAEFLDAGIGLLSITPDSCEVSIPARKSRRMIEPAVEFYSVEKFWKGRKSVTSN